MRSQTIAATVLTWIVLAGGGASAPQEVLAQQLPGRAVTVEGGQYRDIMVPELQAMLQRKNFPMINVHVPFAGDIPLTDASIRYDEVAGNLNQLPADKNAPIVLYCRTGPMSTRAATDLVRLGYTNVYNLVGGFNAWAEAGLPLETR